MKKLERFFVHRSVAVALLCMTCVSAYSQTENYKIKGVYKTLDDYNKGNLCTDYDLLISKQPKYNKFFVEKGQQVIIEKNRYPYVDATAKGVSYDDATFYAYMDKDGFTWRLQLRGNHTMVPYRIVEKGKICVYTSDQVTLETDAKGNITSMNCPSSTRGYYWNDDGKSGGGTTEFFFNFYISNGLNGQLLVCTESNLKKLLADDADIVTKVKDKGIYQLRFHKWGESFSDLMGWVAEYNSKHK